MAERPPRILAWDACHRAGYYAPLREQMAAEWIDGPLSSAAQAVGPAPDLVVVSDEHNPSTSLTVCEYARSGVPVLHFADGVVDWNNTWANPRSEAANGMPLFQPILAHKIACIGRSQARTLEAWGALGLCEVVGVPRFDRFLGGRRRQRRAVDPLNVLVMTANTPAFTADQRALVLQSLADLRDWFAHHSEIGGTRVAVTWRLTGNLAEELGVANQCREIGVSDLATVLDGTDAAIVTPSTAVLECMLREIPVALLDYCNRPLYVPAGWVITAAPHIPTVVPQLLDPAPPRLLFQNIVLHDALECRTPAVPRAVRLINELVRIGRECREAGRPLAFPRRILDDPQDGHHLQEAFDLASLHPTHEVFRDQDLARVQAELGQALIYLRQARVDREQLANRLLRLHVYERLESLPVFGRILSGVRAVLSRCRTR